MPSCEPFTVIDENSVGLTLAAAAAQQMRRRRERKQATYGGRCIYLPACILKEGNHKHAVLCVSREQTATN